MSAKIRQSVVPGESDLVISRPWHPDWVLSSLSEHDLRDIEFALARRRAMGRICPEQDQEHTCSLPPGHLGYASHLCAGCTYHWSGTTLG